MPNAPTDDRNLLRSSIRLAVPSIVENLFHSAVYSVDVLMLAAVGQRELATASFTGMFLWRLTMIVAFCQWGTAAYVARRWGEGRHGMARMAATHGQVLAAACGLVTALVCLPSLPWIFKTLGGSPDIVPLAIAFTTPILVVFPLAQMRVSLSASLRAAGDTLTPQLATLLVNVLNVGFNSVLIFGGFGLPKMGIAGAGLGTAMALACGYAFLAFRVYRGVRPRRIFGDASARQEPEDDLRQEPTAAPVAPLPALRRGAEGGVFSFARRGTRAWVPGVTPSILRVSGSALLEEILISAGFLTFYRMITEFGPTAMAAHSAVSAIEGFSYNTGAGFAVAAATLVGQSLGRRDPGAAVRAMQFCLLFALCGMGLFGIAYCALPEWCLQWYRPDDASAGFMPLAVLLLVIAGFEQPMLGATQTLGGALRGAGDTLSPTIAQLVGTVGIRIGVGWWLAFPMGLGIEGLYLATVIDWTARMLILSVLFWRGRWKRMKL